MREYLTAPFFRLVVILLVTITLLNGCKDDEFVEPPVVAIGPPVLIANQGNFGWGEGTLSVYYPESKSIQNNAYETKNAEALGNVFQSITSANGQYFFLINNSNKIVVTDSNFAKTKEITGLTSPRYMYRVANDKAYVTDLYASEISVIDMKALAIVKTIPVRGWSEKGILHEGKFWFTAPETNMIYAIDIASDAVTDSIEVGEQPESIIKDMDGVIWVLCKGDESKNQKAQLVSNLFVGIDLFQKNMGIEGAIPTGLAYDSLNHSIYFLSDRIWKMRIDEDTEPQSWKQISNAALYTIKVNPKNGDVYASDVKDFVSKSRIYRFSSVGEPLDEFSAGIISGDFFFP
ncbi:MAG: hypothetical protein COA58_15300 [Bacteroidetes bacterium]|nr:MAG: hypothetical protein COA58_15300 [Bacteroidota bacterium]